jgi:MFS family permease
LLVYGTLLASIALVTNAAILAALSFAIGAAAGVVAPIPTALMTDRVPRPLHGVAIGWLRTMTDGGQILGPLVMGTLADVVDVTAPFVVGAVLLAAMAWQCGRRATAMAAAVALEGDS